METLLQDLRYAARQLNKSPGFTGLAVLTFALGIGPATAVLSFADRLVLSPIPGVSDPGRLGTMQYGIRSPRGYFPYLLRGKEKDEVTRDLPAIAAIAGLQGTVLAVSTGIAPAQQYDAEFVDGQYFRVFGLTPQLGRLIDVTDDRPGGFMVAVISHRFWERLFALAPDVVGKTFRANGEVMTVVGVSPKGFRGPNRLGQVDVWMPAAAKGTVQHYPPEVWPKLAPYEFIVRLSREGTFEAAQEQLGMAVQRIAALHPEDRDYEKMEAKLFPGIGVDPLSREHTATTIRLLIAMTGLLLAVACANAANLMLFRGARRRGETALRHAIGATRGRMIASRLAESALLAVAGCAAGIWIALAMINWFEGASISGFGQVGDVTLNFRVLGLALLSAVTTGLLAGVLPALADSRPELATSLKEAQRTGTGARSRIRSGLAVTQVAISLTLLVGSFLFIRTLANLRSVDLGFDPSNVSTSIVSVRGLDYTPERANAFGTQLLERVRGAPGIEQATLSYTAPLVGSSISDRILNATATGEDTIPVFLNAVSPSYFPTLGTSLVAGRAFTDAEMTADLEGPVIISEALARKLFGERNPVGELIRFRRPPSRSVIGVAPNVLWGELTARREDDLSIYQPFIRGPGGMTPGSLLMVRSALDPATVQRTVRQVAASIDPNVPLVRDATMLEIIGRYAADQSLFMKVLTLLAGIAITLAALGIYGLLAQTVAERTREFGIRMAVGAGRPEVMSLVARKGLFLLLLGVPIGLVASYWFARIVRAKLFGVAPTEPSVYLAVSVGLAVVALVACLIPARTAARVDPMVALRSE